MSLDTTRLGEVVAHMMEDLASRYEDHDVVVGTVAVLVEISSGEWTAVTYRCTDHRKWVQRGLMIAGEAAVMASSEYDS